MTSPLQRAIASSWLLFILGCDAQSGPTSRTKPPSSTGGLTVLVTDPYDESKIMLSQKQAQWFIKDISGPGRRSKISEFPAAPLATFTYGNKEFLMHGNAVIHVQDDGTEVLWTGPYLQALVSQGSFIRKSIDAVEKKADLSSVKLDSPGAYPGGGPAPLLKPDK